MAYNDLGPSPTRSSMNSLWIGRQWFGALCTKRWHRVGNSTLEEGYEFKWAKGRWHISADNPHIKLW